MSAPRVAIGVDVGGTKIESVLLDSTGGEHGRHRVATPRGDYEGTIRAISEMVRRAASSAGAGACELVEAIGVGGPGSVSPRTELHRNANSTCLNGRRFREDLAAALGRPVVFANDADCLALSESFDGAARDARVVFAVILGTGCGGGIVVDRSLLQGRNGIVGEWGHSPLPRAGTEDEALPSRRCWCGRVDCLEAWISGPALEREFGAPVGRVGASAAESGVAIARLARRLARALAGVVNLLDPDAIVLGGGVSNAPGLVEALPPLVAPLVFSDSFDTPIVRALHGDSSGVRGAARLVLSGPITP